MIFLFVISLIVVPALGRRAPEIETKYGTVYGKKYRSAGEEIYAYQGIPFALPPVGDRRFKSPQPIENWDGIYNKNKRQKTCYPHNEDCLYLNVFVPKNADSSSKLATVVWIHGGAFQYGSGNKLKPFYFMRNNRIVFVTIEYRLGIFGFLYAKNSEAPGNMGLLDQNMALKWVKENIERFGGDSNNINALGFSAGSASIHYHLTSHKSRNLINKAVMVSGAITSSFAYSPPALMLKYFNMIKKHFDCSKGSDEESVKCLRKLPEEVIKNANEALPRGMGLHPTIDGNFITSPPSVTIHKNSHIPILTILNRDEGIGWARRFFKSSFTEAKQVLDKVESFLDTIPKNTRDKLIGAYFDEEARKSLPIARIASAKMMSDIVNLCPVRNMSKIQANSISPVYSIIFNHFHDKASYFWNDDLQFVDHIAFHPFIYGSFKDGSDYNEDEQKMGEHINDIITSFILHGKLPKENGLSEATVNHGKFIEIKLKEDVINEEWPREKTCKIWNRLKQDDEKDDMPLFLFTDNFMELKERVRRENILKFPPKN